MKRKKENAVGKWEDRQGAGAMLKRAGEKGLDLLFPRRCPLCDRILRREERLCCQECEKKLPWVQAPTCMKCGKSISQGERELCEDCAGICHSFDRGAAAFTYTGALRKSVYRMKFQNRRDYLDFYGEAIALAGEGLLAQWKPQALVPVPMHWRKKRSRGYNQSELLAEKVSRLTGIPVDRGLLICVRYTRSQKVLDRRERLQNLKDSFVVRQGEAIPQRVVVIDDVYTTGSTMDAVSRALKDAGISQVNFLTLCIGKGKKAVCTEENLCYTDYKNRNFAGRNRPQKKKEGRTQNEKHSSMDE